MSDAAVLPDAPTPDQLEALGDEIAKYAAKKNVIEHKLLTLIRLYDRHEAWGSGGFLSCADWLSWRIGLGLKAARERVRVARALAALDKIDAVFGRGELSYSQVRAITRVATAEMVEARPSKTSSTSRVTPRLHSSRRCAHLTGAASSSPRSRARTHPSCAASSVALGRQTAWS